MIRHYYFSAAFCAGIFFTCAGRSQTISRSAGVSLSESVAGVPNSLSYSTNVTGPGSLRGLQTTLGGSGTHGRASVVGDDRALRFSGKTSAHAGQFGGQGPTSSQVSAAVSITDTLRIVSPLVPSGNHPATARVRLLIQSTRDRSGPEAASGGSVGVVLREFRVGTIIWSTNNALPNGEHLFDVPAWVNGTNPPYAANMLDVYASAFSGAQGGLQGGGVYSSSASAGFTVTWGGVVSLQLADGRVIPDFEVNGLKAAYRTQRPRNDLAPAIQAASPAALTLTWAGTANMFYEVQTSTSVGAESWSPLAGAVEGSGNNVLIDSPTGARQRFFRIIDAPLP